MIHLTVGYHFTEVTGPYDETRYIDDELTFDIPGAKYSPAYKNGYWDGQTHMYDADEGKFLSGLTNHVTSILDRLGIEYVLTDSRDRGTIEPVKADTFKALGITLRDYQLKAANKTLVNGGGIISISTAGGKTLTAAAILKHIDKRSVFLVNTAPLAQQTFQRFNMYGLPNVGLIGDGVWQPGKTTVATVQSLYSGLSSSRVQKFLNSREVVIADETHHAGSASFVNVILSTKGHWKIGLSGTPFRNKARSSIEDYLMLGVCGDVSYAVPAAWLKARGYIADPQIYQLPISGAVEGSDWHSVYRRGIIENEDRNNTAVDAIRRLVKADLTVLVLVTSVEHGTLFLRLLAEAGMTARFLYGGYSLLTTLDLDNVVTDTLVDGRPKSVVEFSQRKFPVLVASPVLDEGIDVPECEALVVLGGGKSLVKTLQRLGRVLRPKPGANKAYVVDFNDMSHRWLRQHSKDRLSMYKSEDHTIIDAINFHRDFP